MTDDQKRFTPDTPIAEKLLYFFQRCKLWPENDPRAMGPLLELRNLAEPAALELERLHKRKDELEAICGELYQVIGALADGPVLQHPDVQRALDNASQARFVHTDLLPFPKTPLPRGETAAPSASGAVEGFILETLGSEPDSWNAGEGSTSPGDGSGMPGCKIIAEAVGTWSALQTRQPVSVLAAARAFNATPDVIAKAIEAYDSMWLVVSKRGPTPDQWFIEHDGE